MQAALIAAVRLILGASFDVVWHRRETGFRSDEHCKISVISRSRKGRDEVRFPGGVEHVYGVRVLRVQFRIETQDQDLDSSALDLADQLSAGFERTDVRALLDAAHLGGCQIQATIDASGPDEHGDDRSVAIVEIWFNHHVTHTPAVETSPGYVETVVYSGEAAEGAGGTVEIGPSEGTAED